MTVIYIDGVDMNVGGRGSSAVMCISIMQIGSNATDELGTLCNRVKFVMKLLFPSGNTEQLKSYFGIDKQNKNNCIAKQKGIHILQCVNRLVIYLNDWESLM